MSLIHAIKAQLGLSNTPANNFHLDASAADGTLKLRRGNADAPTQDILTVAPNGTVSIILVEYASDAAASAGGVPIGGLYKTSGAVKVRAV